MLLLLIHFLAAYPYHGTQSNNMDGIQFEKQIIIEPSFNGEIYLRRKWHISRTGIKGTVLKGVVSVTGAISAFNAYTQCIVLLDATIIKRTQA